MNTKFTAKDLFLKHWKHWSFKVKLGLAYSSSQLSETKQADAPKTPITFLYWDFFAAISRAHATMVMTSFKFTSQTQWTRNFCVERTLEIMVFAGRGFWLGILENEVWKSSEHWKHNKHIIKKGTVFSVVFIYKKHEKGTWKNLKIVQNFSVCSVFWTFWTWKDQALNLADGRKN